MASWSSRSIRRAVPLRVECWQPDMSFEGCPRSLVAALIQVVGPWERLSSSRSRAWRMPTEPAAFWISKSFKCDSSCSSTPKKSTTGSATLAMSVGRSHVAVHKMQDARCPARCHARYMIEELKPMPAAHFVDMGGGSGWLSALAPQQCFWKLSCPRLRPPCQKNRWQLGVWTSLEHFSWQMQV